MHQQNALHCYSSYSVFAVASLCTCSVAVIMNIRVNNSSSIAAVLLKPVLQIPHHCTFWMSPSWSHPIQVLQSLLMSSKMCSSRGPQDRFEKHCHSSSIYLFIFFSHGQEVLLLNLQSRFVSVGPEQTL